MLAREPRARRVVWGFLDFGEGGAQRATLLTLRHLSRERFAPGGRAGAVCRQASLNNGLVMRATGDTMIIAPPLICTTAEIDTLVERAKAALDEAARELGAG